MAQNFTSNNFNNDEVDPHNEESEYKNLISRIQEISRTIALLEKTIFR